MVEPAAISYFRNKGYIPYEVHQRLKVSRDVKNAWSMEFGKSILKFKVIDDDKFCKAEYDLLLEAPEHKTAMLVSAKTHVSSRDVNELEEE